MTEIVTLYKNPWLALKEVRDPDKGVNGYVFSYENSCQGKKVAILPYRRNPNGLGVDFLVKSEITPCWGMESVMSAITGGYEGGTVEDNAVKEMLEETGYAITRDELVSLGTCYASKSSDTVYYLYTVNLTGREPGEALGDGSRLESEALATWVDFEDIADMPDAQLNTMMFRWLVKIDLA